MKRRMRASEPFNENALFLRRLSVANHMVFYPRAGKQCPYSGIAEDFCARIAANDALQRFKVIMVGVFVREENDVNIPQFPMLLDGEYARIRQKTESVFFNEKTAVP